MIYNHNIFIVIEIVLLIIGIWIYYLAFRKNFRSNTLKQKNYNDYMRSQKWEKLRKQALERAQYKCELCGQPYEAVHHIKYPKRYSDDHIDNLLVVCDSCHAKLHGIRDLKYKNENFMDLDDNVFFEEVFAGSIKYLFTVKQLENKQKILIIQERRRKEKYRSAERMVTLSSDNFESFSNILEQAIEYLEKNKGDVKSKMLFSEKLSLNEISYFFDVKIAVNQRKYLMITESKKQNDRFERHHIIFFEDQISLFINGFLKASQFL